MMISTDHSGQKVLRECNRSPWYWDLGTIVLSHIIISYYYVYRYYKFYPPRFISTGGNVIATIHSSVL